MLGVWHRIMIISTTLLQVVRYLAGSIAVPKRTLEVINPDYQTARVLMSSSAYFKVCRCPLFIIRIHQEVISTWLVH